MALTVEAYKTQFRDYFFILMEKRLHTTSTPLLKGCEEDSQNCKNQRAGSFL